MAENQVAKTFPVQSRLKPTSKTTTSPPESKYWRSFKTTQIPNLIYPITSIDFSPLPPHDFAATFSASVTFYSSKTTEQKSNITSFKDIAYSAAYRSDGKLLAAGGETGVIQIFDIKHQAATVLDMKKTRYALRQLRGHTRAVRLVKYPRFDKLHLFSGGDDSLVKFWDVATETQLLNFQGHKDYVRSGSASPVSNDLFATGSYDHTVKVWDSRGVSYKPVVEFNHGKPVEDVMFLPSGGLIATAGGDSVKIWDVIGGGRLVYSMESHNKTVTKMCVGKARRDNGGGDEGDQFRILSVSLDGYMKVFDYAAMKVTHSMRFPHPLMSIAVSPDSSTRVIGTSNGILYVARKKKKEMDSDVVVGNAASFGAPVEVQKPVLKRTNFRYFSRGQGEKPSEFDHIIERTAKVKLAEHDKLFKKFRAKKAMVSALGKGNPRTIMAVMEELVTRNKLLKSVSNLSVEEFEILLRFLHKYTTLPSYSGFLIGFTRKVMQMRAEDVTASDVLQGHVRQLKRAVEEEIHIQQSLQEIQGIISPLLRIAGRS